MTDAITDPITETGTESSFLRPDLAAMAAYTHQAGEAGEAINQPLDPLDTNESPLDLPPDLKEKLAWQYQQEIAANRYPDGGHGALKAAIAAYVNETASDLSASPITAQHISVGNGSDELIRSLLIATCVGGAGSILVAQPTFSMYGILARTLGVPVVSVDRHEHDFSVDLEAARAAIATAPSPVRLVFMVHPNSPTANPLTAAELDWLRALPPSTLVVIDEAYFEFCQHTTVAEVTQRPNWVVTRTFSKAFRLAAHRVGYAIAPPPLTAVLEKVRLPYNLPSFSQAAARLALAERQTLLGSIPDLIAARQQLATALQSLNNLRIWPSAANFIYVRPTQACQPHQSPDDALQAIFQQLKALGTLVRQTGGGLRITLGTPPENQRTLAHLRQVLADFTQPLPSTRAVTVQPPDPIGISTPDDLRRAYGQGQRNFANLSLAQANLQGIDLKGIDLSYADLSEAQLTRANLRGADLSYANLRGADLSQADFRGAMLIGTDLRQANLDQTDFHQADYDPTETRFPTGFNPVLAQMNRDRP